jgi:hypothetical protein
MQTGNKMQGPGNGFGGNPDYRTSKPPVRPSTPKSPGSGASGRMGNAGPLAGSGPGRSSAGIIANPKKSVNSRTGKPGKMRAVPPTRAANKI